MPTIEIIPKATSAHRDRVIRRIYWMLRQVYGSEYRGYGKPILEEIKRRASTDAIVFTVNGPTVLWSRALARHINKENTVSVRVDRT